MLLYTKKVRTVIVRVLVDNGALYSIAAIP